MKARWRIRIWGWKDWGDWKALEVGSGYRRLIWVRLLGTWDERGMRHVGYGVEIIGGGGSTVDNGCFIGVVRARAKE